MGVCVCEPSERQNKNILHKGHMVRQLPAPPCRHHLPCALLRPRRTTSQFRHARAHVYWMSRRHIVGAGCRGPVSRPAQPLYSHERGTEVGGPRELVHRKVEVQCESG